eukprot:TRINITY_DN19429_c0_g2_i1.p1 TRINITY_DN19429_c0_g2~~TRINITY_DN19429_c0_g2_i1.p1  ORF type:complete len:163 (-),score=42.66 TRINITY_DN19429_c0_g2_i1:60-548(-)
MFRSTRALAMIRRMATASPPLRVATQPLTSAENVAQHMTFAAEKKNSDNACFHGVLRDSFEYGDLNFDGVLDRTEFKTLIRRLGLDWDSDRVRHLFDNIDLSKDGFIQPEEWHTALHHALEMGSKYTPACAAEAEEADETGYTGMLQDSQILLDKLKTLLSE